MDILPSQRALFDIPRDVCFLNAASWSPLPFAVQKAGREGVALKGRPWQLDRDFTSRQYERARAAAARLIHAGGSIFGYCCVLPAYTSFPPT